MTDDELRAYAKASHAAMYHKPPAKKRSSKTPEAKVSAAVDKYLKQLGCINIRTNSGSWQDEAGHWIMGAKAGTSDKTCCLPNGIFCAVECKASTKLTDAQRKYLDRVEALGGVAIVAYSKENVRIALVERFGLATVELWEKKR